MSMFRPILLAAALAAGLAAAPAARAAETYPARPIRVIVPFAAGGPTDMIARPFCEELSRAMGQQFVIDNRGGGTGSIGAEAVARSAPDGYTLMMTPLSTFIIVPRVRKVNYDPVKDFVPIARLGDQLNGLAVHPSLGVKTVKEFVALAKSKPGQLYYASAGAGGIQNLRVEVFKKMAGIDLVHVPYKGSGEAMPDLLAGNVQVMVDVIVFPQVKAGKLTLLATMDGVRHPDFPDTPTIQESGFPDYDMPNFYVFAAPSGVAPEIVERLNAASNRIGQQPEFAQRLLVGGYRTAADSPTAVKERLSTLATKYAGYIKAVDFKAE